MPLQPDLNEVDIDLFNGANTRSDPYSVPPSNALYAQNSAYVRGKMSTRLGHSSTGILINTDGAITTLQNWFFTFLGQPQSVVLYYAPTQGIRGYTQTSPAFTAILIAVTGAAGSVMIPTGQRLYAAFYDSTGRLAASQAYVYGWNGGADKLFAPPIQNPITAAETGAGVVTQGVHKIGYATTTRNGYTGRLSPVDTGGTFTPISFTSTGGQNLQLTINTASPSFPSWMGTGATVQIVMTTVEDPNTFYAVPGAVASFLGTVVITISINDEDLAATGTDLTPNNLLLAQTQGGTGPFTPSNMCPYSNRMAYIAIDGSGFPVVYISNPNNFQYVTPDQHAVYLENLQQPIAAFSLRGVLYIATQFSFYAATDNGNVPATWTSPQRVDGSIGVLSPSCIYSNPASGYALIASDRGFYLFQGGIFPALPISYYQLSDWSRINWNVPTTISVVDDQLNKRFIVSAPLNDVVASISGTGPFTVTTKSTYHLYQSGLSVKFTSGSTQTITVTGNNTFTVGTSPTVGDKIMPLTATHQMKWDYTEGDTPDTVKYSLDSMSAYNVGAIGTVQNLATSLSEVWYACSASGGGPIIRQNDGSEAQPYRDATTANGTSAINHLYKTSLIPGQQDRSQILHSFYGAYFRVLGSGNMTILVSNLDDTKTLTPVLSPLALSLTPGQEQPVMWSLDHTDQQTITLGMNALDSFMVVSLIRAEYANDFAQR